ncbi:reverse transcriptase [Senna tora]|uniref:Reverse transcriptase n=1 Tax=Senna tora TaxID=362788 RepID=A0A834SFW5_9FABA|nr:reverse transcriptase [Senna tora]
MKLVDGKAWFCLGDFNDILSNEEKSGGLIRSTGSLLEFQNLVFDCDWVDLGFKGPMEQFQNAQVLHLEAIGSDHRSLIINLKYDVLKVRRSFKFESMWIEHKEFLDVVKAGWSWSSEGGDEEEDMLRKRLDKCSMVLREWSKKAFPNNLKEIERRTNCLEMCRNGVMIMEKRVEVSRILKHIEEIWDREEKYWHQRARVNWLLLGIKIRGLFKSVGGRDMSQALRFVKKGISVKDNEALMRKVSKNEVKRAAFDLGALKAPGPDGFSGSFFHSSWDIIGLLCGIKLARRCPSLSHCSFADDSLLFLNAMKGSRASWGWSSILAGRDTLNLGLGWKLGSGEKISIWKDRWLPPLHNFLLSSVVPSVEWEDKKVSSLIVNSNWDLNEVQEYLSVEEVRAIRSIPIPIAKKVLDSYVVAKASSSFVVPKDIWKAIWRNEDETREHLLHFCKWLESILWFGSMFCARWNRFEVRRVDEWWCNLLLGDGKVDDWIASLFAYTCWHIWKPRCRKVFEHEEVDSAFVIQRSFADAAKFWNLNGLMDDVLNCGKGLVDRSVWSPPVGNDLKINCDASFLPDFGVTGLGVVIRNCNGEVIVGRSIRSSAFSVNVAEALALKEALKTALELNLMNFSVESDCRDLVKAVNSKDLKWDWCCSEIVKEILLLCGHLNWPSIMHIKRNAKMVADWLAKNAAQWVCPLV